MTTNDIFGGDGSGNLANDGQYVEIYHIPSGNTIKFKAMMTQFEDAYTSEWNSEAAYGRMDPIQTFQRTGRVISIAFSVPAYSRKEAHGNLQRISALVQFLYPSYDGAGLLKNSPYCKIQFMNWSAKNGAASAAKTQGLLGTIGGFTFVPDLDAGVFHSKTGEDIAPKMVQVAFQFTVIHEHKLGWQGDALREPGLMYFPYGVETDTLYSKGADADPDFLAAKSIEQMKKIPAWGQQDALVKDITDSSTCGGADWSSSGCRVVKVRGKYKLVSRADMIQIRDRGQDELATNNYRGGEKRDTKR